MTLDVYEGTFQPTQRRFPRKVSWFDDEPLTFEPRRCRCLCLQDTEGKRKKIYIEEKMFYEFNELS